MFVLTVSLRAHPHVCEPRCLTGATPLRHSRLHARSLQSFMRLELRGTRLCVYRRGRSGGRSRLTATANANASNESSARRPPMSASESVEDLLTSKSDELSFDDDDAAERTAGDEEIPLLGEVQPKLTRAVQPWKSSN